MGERPLRIYSVRKTHGRNVRSPRGRWRMGAAGEKNGKCLFCQPESSAPSGIMGYCGHHSYPRLTGSGYWPGAGAARPQVVHAGQGLKVGLYTPTILGGNSYLSWFCVRGPIKVPAHTGTSKGISQAINRGPIRKFLPNYANVDVTTQSHGHSAGARTHYATANEVRNGLWCHPRLAL